MECDLWNHPFSCAHYMTFLHQYKNRKSWPQNVRLYVLAIISGVALICSFPKYGVGWVAWFALVPLLLAVRAITMPLKAAMVGFVTGFVFYLGILYWLSPVVITYGNLPYWLGVLALVLLSVYLSLYFACFAAGLVYLRERGFAEFITAPLLWVCLEFLKTILFSGFPWENLAYSQYQFLTIIQFSDITGTYGVSFLLVLMNAIQADIFMEGKKRKRVFLEMIFGCIILFILLAYGMFSLNRVSAELNRAEALEVSLIQGNIDQNTKWNSSYQQGTVDIYRALSLKNAPVGEGLIVWPETAMPFFFRDNRSFTPQVHSVVKLASDWLLFGSPSYQKDGERIWYMNSAFLLAPNGGMVGKYDKVHLVPYGEYVPLRTFFPFLDKLVEGVGDFKKGDNITPLPLGKHALGVLICYEGIFPWISREYKKKGSGLLVNITNDAWFGPTSAPYQHLSMTVFRAVENRTFLLRAANTGISAIISPTGAIVKQTELFKRTALKGSIKFLDRKTIYTLYGDIFTYVCLILLGLIILTAKKGARDYV